ncbi:SDR family NAD(P)-dependent oxidoreductase [Hymenobacter sp. CRA2]|uniref:SDR family NAD(P)-dependent oxidoreductase n=1 Tax=Hymenobacter sp. CRA2 TaxID=1955620 RepID=UPI00098FF488|nr:SDR family NAD(P)-dependent oxidoreductase [Hymenobacter sp. CRA2]OON68521.1 short-chain dehydrogenase/reductase [Hymenobacter sp. CRA2]
MKTNQIWFVTGASRGLGLALVRQLLATGYSVAATSRNLAELRGTVPPEQAGFLALHMDLGDEASVQQALTAAVTHFGRLDVVVNNAGFGQLGALEELTDAESRRNFDVNVFGLLHVLRHATPLLRAQGRGRVFNIASIGGFTGAFPGWGVYCATKFAVAGLTASYAAEVREFGVQASVVYPGYFRTDFLTASSLGTPAQPMAAYQAVRESQQAHEQSINGNQPGDPEKAAQVLIEVSHAEQQPLHLFLGADAYQLADQQLQAVQQDMQQWQAVATATDLAVNA